MASLASGYRFLTASARTWEQVCLYAFLPSSESKVRMFSSQSLSMMVRRSAVSPSISARQAALASPFRASVFQCDDQFIVLQSFFCFCVRNTKIPPGNLSEGTHTFRYPWFHPSSEALYSASALISAFHAASGQDWCRSEVVFGLPVSEMIPASISLWKAQWPAYCPRQRFTHAY